MRKRNTPIKTLQATCNACQADLILTGDKRKAYIRTGKAYCTKECSHSFQYGKIARAKSSERMKTKNPMWMLGVKEKMIQSSKGKKFVVRGGNGSLTAPQKKLHNATGLKLEHPIVTAGVKHMFENIPNSYKVDLACLERKIAIEIDGNSHNGIKQKTLDKKKDAVLTALGWKVLRFSNSEVLNGLDHCVKIIMSTT